MSLTKEIEHIAAKQPTYEGTAISFLVIQGQPVSLR